MACKLLKSSAGHTNSAAGDGTTTSTVLAGYLLARGFRAIDSGFHAMQIKHGMNVAAALVSQILERRLARRFKNRQELEAVVLVACNYDTQLARVVSQALVGQAARGNGLSENLDIRIEPSWSQDNQVRFSQEITLDRGLADIALAGQNSTRLALSHPLVLVVAARITQVEQILPILELAKRASRPLLIFSELVDDAPLSILIYNNKQQKGQFSSAAVNIPFLVGMEKQILKDIALITGATLIDNEYQHFLNQVKFDHLGGCEAADLTELQTSLKGVKGSPQKIISRIDEIKAIIDKSNARMKQVHAQRLVALQGGQVVIGVGGRTEVEKNQNYDKVVDALNAGKAGLKEGLLPGSGMGLYHAARLAQPYLLRGESEFDFGQILDGPQDAEYFQLENQDQRAGARLLCEVCQLPARKIIENAGRSAPVELSRVKNEKEGFDARSGKVVDLLENKIYDTLLVSRTALQNAVSTAGMLLTSECNVVRVKSFKPMPLKEYDYLKADL